MARRHPRSTASPWTALLGYVLTDEQRTTRAQRLMLTITGCAGVLLLILLSLALLASGVVGWIPLAEGGGTLIVLGIATRLCAARRRRRLHPPKPASPDEDPSVNTRA